MPRGPKPTPITLTDKRAKRVACAAQPTITQDLDTRACIARPSRQVRPTPPSPRACERLAPPQKPETNF